MDLLRASGELPKISHEDMLVDTTCIPSEGEPDVSVQQRDRDGDDDSTASPGPSVSGGGAASLSGGPAGPQQMGSDYRDVTMSGGSRRVGVNANGVPSTYNCYAPPTCICRAQEGERPAPPMEADEALLETYRTELAPQFPFVLVAADTTPAQLAAAKPFTWAAIKMVSSFRSARSMRAQKYRLMAHLAEHMVLRSERSLDLLQGIVVMLGWYHYHCLMHAQLNNLLHMALSLAGDLGLTRHPAVAERTRLIVLNPEQPKVRTPDEKRVACAVWYLSSVVACGFHKVEPMRFSRYLGGVLRELEADREVDSDAALVAMVKLQHLVERIQQFSAREADEKEGDDGELPGIPRAPAQAYVAAFQVELDRIRAGMGKGLRSSKVIQAHINTVNLHLYEPPIIDSALISSLTSTLSRIDPVQSPESPTALDTFYQSVAALRTWFDAWLMVPIPSYFHLPMPLYAHLIYAITMLSRWARLTCPAPGAPSAMAVAAAAAAVVKQHNDIRGVGGIQMPPPRSMPSASVSLGQTSSDGRSSAGGLTPSSSAPSSVGGGSSVPSLVSASTSLSSLSLSEQNSCIPHRHPTEQSSATTASLSPQPPPSTPSVAGGMAAGSSTGGAANTPNSSSVPPPANSTTTAGALVSGPTANSPYYLQLHHADPSLPAAVAHFRQLLLRQPGLQLDIPEMLAAIGQRFEQAFAALKEERREAGRRRREAEARAQGGKTERKASVRVLGPKSEDGVEGDDDYDDNGEGGEADAAAEEERQNEEDEDEDDDDDSNNIWTLGAKKLNVTRAKLERWAEIVAAGGGEAVLMGLKENNADGTGEGQEESAGGAVDASRVGAAVAAGLASDSRQRAGLFTNAADSAAARGAAASASYMQSVSMAGYSGNNASIYARPLHTGVYGPPPGHALFNPSTPYTVDGPFNLAPGAGVLPGSSIVMSIEPPQGQQGVEYADGGADTAMLDMEGGSSGVAGTNAQENCLPENQEGWQCDPLWTNDLFEGWEPNMWFDGGMDWQAMGGV